MGGWSDALKKGRFKLSLMYIYLRPAAPIVPWKRLMCNNNWLSTKDRLLKWKVKCDFVCVLFNAVPESAQHIFFACSVSEHVWQAILMAIGVQRKPSPLDQVLQWNMPRSRTSSNRN
ncbi:Xaa-Pro dipeptidyl-peptidase [Bienertia sinuspersici]